MAIFSVAKLFDIAAGIINQAVFSENFIKESLVNGLIISGSVNLEDIAVKAASVTMNGLSISVISNAWSVIRVMRIKNTA